MTLRPIDELFAQLARSPFRRRFHLGPRERAYLDQRGLAAVLDHGRRLIAERLAPAHPANDGKQTPMRGHPVFVAQHATATCCRGCLQKWHRIPTGRALSDAERDHVIAVIGRWIEVDAGRPTDNEPPQAATRAEPPRQLRLL